MQIWKLLENSGGDRFTGTVSQDGIEAPVTVKTIHLVPFTKSVQLAIALRRQDKIMPSGRDNGLTRLSLYLDDIQIEGKVLEVEQSDEKVDSFLGKIGQIFPIFYEPQTLALLEISNCQCDRSYINGLIRYTIMASGESYESCPRCKYHFGHMTAGQYLHCTPHPFGRPDANCPDFEVSK